MVTDPQTHTNPQTGPITIHCAAASLAVSVIWTNCLHVAYLHNKCPKPSWDTYTGWSIGYRAYTKCNGFTYAIPACVGPACIDKYNLWIEIDSCSRQVLCSQTNAIKCTMSNYFVKIFRRLSNAYTAHISLRKRTTGLYVELCALTFYSSRAKRYTLCSQIVRAIHAARRKPTCTTVHFQTAENIMIF